MSDGTNIGMHLSVEIVRLMKINYGNSKKYNGIVLAL
jgi:hypothetical protein